MHSIEEITSFYSEYFRSRAYVGAKLLTISQPTSWDNQPRPPLIVLLYNFILWIELEVIRMSTGEGKSVQKYIQWLTPKIVHSLKSHNIFKIGPNDLSSFEKLERLVF